ncbi:MAG: hypothetical protein COT74_05055 [Bdellovibrionales bacterium CG10_big_fil_rev_8_21_14_0_10_45_34]|nr:MAG: hypothetical protein COT74_05055 [Bdellovibrionales bacterium CG10_big_fil_rev_8_21_14_0_10_45_34]
MSDLSSKDAMPDLFQIQKLHGEDIGDEDQIIYGDAEPSLEWSDSKNASRYVVRIYRADDAALICSQSVTDVSTFIENCNIPEDSLVKISVQALSPAGKSRDALKRPYFMLDRTPPNVAFTSTPGAAINTSTASFLIGASDSGSGVQRVECRLGNSGVFTACPYGDSPYSVTVDTPGSYSLYVRAYDNAGKVSSTVTHTFAYDPTVIGTFSIVGVTGGADSVADVCLTSGSTPTFSWGASTNADSYDVTVYQADGVTEACATQNTTSTSFAPAGCNLTSGSYRLAVAAKRSSGTGLDASNNLFAFTVDTVAASANSTIAGTTPVVANGTSTSTITITLLNSSLCSIQGITPTFGATDTGSANAYAACSASNSAGVSTCTMTSTKAESKTLSITGPLAKSGGTVIFTHGAASAVLFAQQPSTSTVAGVDFASQPIVHVVDANGNIITSGVDASAQVTLSVTTGVGSINGTTTVTASSGVATFTGLDMTVSGAKVMTATKQDLSGSGGIGALAVASNGYTITHAAASKIVFATSPGSAKYGQAFNPQGIIEVQDQYDNRVTTGADASATITISKHAGSGTLAGTLTEAASSGVADLSGNGIANDTVGTITLRATKPDLTGSGGVGVLTVDASVVVTPVSCDSGNFATTCTISTVQDVPNGATIAANNLTIASSGQLRNLNNLEGFTINLTGNLTTDGASKIQANVEVNAVNMQFNNTPNDTVACGGAINAAGLGGLGGKRTGNDSITGLGSGGGTCIDSSGWSCSGASHAGLGGAGEAVPAVAAVYGSSSLANTFGSGGGGPSVYAAGGSGGGRIRLVASGTITAPSTGFIASACGGSGGAWNNLNAGGGSGGSIYVEATGFSGEVRLNARGGTSGGGLTSTYKGSGGGSGGYIKVVSPKLLSATNVIVFGLSGTHATGEDGMYEQTVADWSVALCDSGDLATTCTVSSKKFVPHGANIVGTGSIVVASGGQIVNNQRLATYSINLGGNFTVNSGGSVTGNLYPLVATNITLNGQIIASSIGYPGAGPMGGTTRANGGGPGGGQSGESGGVRSGGGGGYGGAGGSGAFAGSTGGAAYGSVNDPTDFGSGGALNGLGGYSSAGSGGGKLSLQASGNIVISSTGGVLADGGGPGGDNAGGGSGGTIRIAASNFTLASLDTNLSAQGGQGGPVGTSGVGGGGGGGGRIWIDPATKIVVTSGPNTSFFRAFDVRPGPVSSGSSAEYGSIGYEYAVADDICDTGSLNTTCNIHYFKPIPDGYTVSGTGSLVIGDGSTSNGGLSNLNTEESFTVNMSGDVTLRTGAGWIRGNATINAANLTLEQGSGITATSQGHPGANTHGSNSYNGVGVGGGLFGQAAAQSQRVGAAGGGGHGGAGGAGSVAGASGGATYGLNTAPITFGSGGAGTENWAWSTVLCNGGIGGGALAINVTGDLTMGHLTNITASGSSGGSHVYMCGGGGAGGSIYINAGGAVSLFSATSQIQARGGDGGTGSTYQCGGGGGGRISIVRGSGSAVDTASLSVTGGASSSEAGAAGTIYQN